MKRSAAKASVKTSVIAAAFLGFSPAVQAEPFERFGTTMKYGLPAAAAICAARDDRLEDFVLRGVVQTAVILALKHWTSDMTIGQRPNGSGEGFPSGHAGMAAFGAADLSGKCFEDEPAAGAALYSAAALTAYSRVRAAEHSSTQALSGMLIGLSFGAASFGIGSQGASISFGMRF